MADEPNNQQQGGDPSVQNLSGGVTRVTPQGDADAQAQANQQSANGGQPPSPAAKPEGLPEGYETLEAFVAAVNDGTYKTPAKEGTDQGTQQQQAPAQQEGQQDVRLVPYTTEVMEKGELSEASIAKAATDFLGKDTPENRALVQNYVELFKGQMSSTEAATLQPFHEAAGGADNYKAFQQWSAEGLSEAEANALNKALDTGQTDVALQLAKSYMEKWKADGGGTPARDLTQQAGNGGQPVGDTYESWEQVRRDMAKPEYEKDPAFRAKVEQKLGRSPL